METYVCTCASRKDWSLHRKRLLLKAMLGANENQSADLEAPV